MPIYIYPIASIFYHTLNFIHPADMLYTAFQMFIYVFVFPLSKIKKIKCNAFKRFIKTFSGQIYS